MTSKFVLKLLRSGVAKSFLPSITDVGVIGEPVFTRPSFVDTVNDIRVQYSKRNTIPIPGPPDAPDQVVEYWGGIFVRHDMTVRVYGVENRGVRGIGIGGDEWAIGEEVGPDIEWAQIASKGASAYGVATNGDLYSWGYGLWYGLGNGSTTNLYEPTLVGTGYASVWTQDVGPTIAAIKIDGTAYMWGYNYRGECGVGYASTSSPYCITTPTLVDGGHLWQKISIGQEHTIGLTLDGTAYGWGIGWYGQLGIGSFPAYGTGPYSPTACLIGACTDISAGSYASLWLKDGYVYVAGEDGYGQFGDGGFGPPDYTMRKWHTPTIINALSNISYFPLNNYYLSAVDVSGQGYAWGRFPSANSNGARIYDPYADPYFADYWFSSLPIPMHNEEWQWQWMGSQHGVNVVDGLIYVWGHISPYYDDDTPLCNTYPGFGITPVIFPLDAIPDWYGTWCDYYTG